jgi:hypothetical protein
MHAQVHVSSLGCVLRASPNMKLLLRVLAKHRGVRSIDWSR